MKVKADRINELKNFGYKSAEEFSEMRGFAIKVADPENVVFVDLEGAYGEHRKFYFNDPSNSNDLMWHLRAEIAAGLIENVPEELGVKYLTKTELIAKVEIGLETSMDMSSVFERAFHVYKEIIISGVNNIVANLRNEDITEFTEDDAENFIYSIVGSFEVMVDDLDFQQTLHDGKLLCKLLE